MTSPYSLDLRQRVVETYKEGTFTQEELAKRYKISISSLKRYLRLDRETGDLLPKINGRGNQGRPGKIDDHGHALLKELVEKNPTITLGELADIFYKEKNIKLSLSMVSRALSKLNLRFKKLTRYASEKNRDDIKKNGRNILKR